MRFSLSNVVVSFFCCIISNHTSSLFINSV